MIPPSALREVLGARVLVQGARVGYVSGVLFDGCSVEAIGLEVTSAAGARRFLPWVAATIVNRDVVPPSALFLIDSSEAYVARGAVVCRDLASLALHAARAHGGGVSAGVLAGTSLR